MEKAKNERKKNYKRAERKESKVIMFIAYLKQKYDGCDYTISCGTRLIKLEAATKEEALRELKLEVLGAYSIKYDERDDGYWNESILESVCLFEVTNTKDIPIQQWYNDAIEEDKIQKLKATQNKEYTEYKRLKTKFEKED